MQRVRDTQHPLAHRLLGKHPVDQQCSTLGHAPDAAAGTESPAFAAESDQMLGMLVNDAEGVTSCAFLEDAWKA